MIKIEKNRSVSSHNKLWVSGGKIWEITVKYYCF